MSQIVSNVKEIITPNTATARAIDDGYFGRVESADAFVRLAEEKEVLASYGTRRFKDLRCPICGRFACGGC